MKKITNQSSNIFFQCKKTWFALQLLIVTATFPVTFYLQAMSNDNKEQQDKTVRLAEEQKQPMADVAIVAGRIN